MTAKIRETPAKTFAGLAVKARVLRFETHLDEQGHLPEEDQDWPEFVMNKFVAELVSPSNLLAILDDAAGECLVRFCCGGGDFYRYLDFFEDEAAQLAMNIPFFRWIMATNTRRISF